MNQDKANRIVESLKETVKKKFKNLIPKEPEQVSPNVEICFCPKCSGANVGIEEIHEDCSERGYCILKCRDCGALFILLEDEIDYSRRGIMNAENNIKFQEEKIKYFDNLLRS